jgi:hypothetical protein
MQTRLPNGLFCSSEKFLKRLFGGGNALGIQNHGFCGGARVAINRGLWRFKVEAPSGFDGEPVNSVVES